MKDALKKKGKFKVCEFNSYNFQIWVLGQEKIGSQDKFQIKT